MNTAKLIELLVKHLMFSTDKTIAVFFKDHEKMQKATDCLNTHIGHIQPAYLTPEFVTYNRRKILTLNQCHMLFCTSTMHVKGVSLDLVYMSNDMSEKDFLNILPHVTQSQQGVIYFEE